MRALFPTATHRCRSSEEGHSLLGGECGLTVRDKHFHKTLSYLLKHLWGFILCKP
jgi:hypothetical protein